MKHSIKRVKISSISNRPIFHEFTHMLNICEAYEGKLSCLLFLVYLYITTKSVELYFQVFTKYTKYICMHDKCKIFRSNVFISFHNKEINTLEHWNNNK